MTNDKIIGVEDNYKGDLKVEIIYGGKPLLKVEICDVKGDELTVKLEELHQKIMRSLDLIIQGKGFESTTIGLGKEDYDKFETDCHYANKKLGRCILSKDHEGKHIAEKQIEKWYNSMDSHEKNELVDYLVLSGLHFFEDFDDDDRLAIREYFVHQYKDIEKNGVEQ